MPLLPLGFPSREPRCLHALPGDLAVPFSWSRECLAARSPCARWGLPTALLFQQFGATQNTGVLGPSLTPLDHALCSFRDAVWFCILSAPCQHHS